MALYKILRAGDPLLRQKSLPIPENEIGSKEIKKLIRDMFDTMREAEGLGLAAPQIGVLKQLVVVGSSKSERYPELQDGIERKVLINPKIEILEKETLGFWEGCLSVPGMRGYVERPRKIKLSYYNEKEDFSEEIIEGFDAIVFQHECDHLKGVLYIDRLKDPRLFGFNEELEELTLSKKTDKELAV